jgi:hypothetical protein
MKRLICVALCLMTLAAVTACGDFSYDRTMYPEARHDPGNQ